MEEKVSRGGALVLRPKPILDHHLDHLIESAALTLGDPPDRGIDGAPKTDMARNVAPRWLWRAPHTTVGVSHTFGGRNSCGYGFWSSFLHAVSVYSYLTALFNRE